jgi:arylsulfatase A-like enzyme/Flp pilus assembly protein TadD
VGETPNVVLITIDTLRADRVGCYGYKQAHTPNLDSLARQGVFFRTVVASVPLTLPSHCSILTGTYPTAHGVRDNVGYRLPPGRTTLAEMMKSRGYNTAAFVGAYVLDRKRGLDRGFDTYSSPFQTNMRAGGPRVVKLSTLERKAEEVVADAVEWLNKPGREPFFVWIHLYDPHDPYEPPARFRALLRDPYDGEVAYADFALGRLFDLLKTQASIDRTLIVATSDHGESFGEHGEFTHGYFIYDTTLLVPLIIKGQAGLAVAPRSIDAPVRTIDIAPTILQFAGIPVPPVMQGNGLLSLIQGKRDDARPTDAYSETYYPNQFGWSALRSLRQRRYKYIDAPEPELYDLRADPSELHNLAKSNRALANELKSELEVLEARSTRKDQPQQNPATPDDAELLRSLGYVAASTPLPNSVKQQALPDPKAMLPEYRRLMAAVQEVSEGHCLQAIPVLERLTREDPRLFMGFALLGHCRFDSGEYQSAATAFRSAAHLRPEDIDALFYSAACDFHLGNLEAAAAGMEHALKFQADYSYAHYYLGLIYQQKRQLESALMEFRKCITINPDFEEAQFRLGYILAQRGEYPEAIQRFERVVSLNPRKAEAHYDLALAYAHSGHGEEARQEFQAACRLDSTLCGNPQH